LLEPGFDVRFTDPMPERGRQQQGGRIHLTPAGRSS
jgi:hypothetical protein